MSKIDLSALRMEETDTALPRRPIGPRLLAGAAIVLVLGVTATFVWPLLRPARAVRMVQVRGVAGPVAAAMSIAEAVGWVEADPFPVIVRPLVAGRIESIEVLEGAAVKAGETVIARLASAELLAASERAEAEAAEREAMVGTTVAELGVATARLEQKGELRTDVADARTELAAAEARLAALTAAIARMQAEARGTRAAAEAQQRLHDAGTVNEIALERARAAADGADAALAAARAEAQGALAEREARAQRLALAEELLAAPKDLEAEVAVKRAAVAQARANCDVAHTALVIAYRELRLATVLAPVDGIVMRLHAAPGANTGPEGEGILSLYDPSRLRARIDVPLGSIGGIREGQEVEVRSEATGTVVVRGKVQRLQHESDLLKNTLQVKVELVDPPPLLRPETLCRARFLASADPATPAAAAPTAFLVPKAAVHGGSVFVFDPARRCARAIAVTAVGEQGDDAVVQGELSVTQRVVLTEVADGEAVREELP